MKQLWRVLILTLMLAAMFVTYVSAVEIVDPYIDDYVVTAHSGTLSYVEEAGTTPAHYTTTCSGLTNGSQYVLLVVKAEGLTLSGIGITTEAALGSVANATYAVSEDTIMYIDQKAATGGAVSFDFIPKSVPDSLVLLAGGVETTGPAIIGALKGQGVTVTGNVKFQISNISANVEIKKGNNSEGSTTTDADGNYELTSIPTDTGYSLIITKPSYCSYTLTGISIEEEKVISQIDISQLAGDIDGNETVNGYDLNDLLQMFNKTGADITTVGADIDGNAAVNGYDLQYLLNSFNKSAITITAN